MLPEKPELTCVGYRAPLAEPDPAAALERAELRRRVAAAIDGLPAREREVLVLKEYTIG